MNILLLLLILTGHEYLICKDFTLSENRIYAVQRSPPLDPSWGAGLAQCPQLSLVF
jgi:hypothetical protein